MDCSQVFGFQFSSVILTDIMLTVLETRMFAIQCYQSYGYPSMWALVTGSLLWARQSSGIHDTAP